LLSLTQYLNFSAHRNEYEFILWPLDIFGSGRHRNELKRFVTLYYSY